MTPWLKRAVLWCIGSVVALTLAALVLVANKKGDRCAYGVAI